MVIVPIMIFSIPIVAILCGTYLKLTRLRIESEQKNNNSEEVTALKKQMLYLEAEQEMLLQRIEQLENNQRQQGFPIEELEKIEINKQKMKR